MLRKLMYMVISVLLFMAVGKHVSIPRHKTDSFHSQSLFKSPLNPNNKLFLNFSNEKIEEKEEEDNHDDHIDLLFFPEVSFKSNFFESFLIRNEIQQFPELPQQILKESIFILFRNLRI